MPPSYEVTFAIDNKDIADLQTAMVAMTQEQFAGVKLFQNALKNSGQGDWMKAQIAIAEALRGAP